MFLDTRPHIAETARLLTIPKWERHWPVSVKTLDETERTGSGPGEANALNKSVYCSALGIHSGGPDNGHCLSSWILLNPKGNGGANDLFHATRAHM